MENFDARTDMSDDAIMGFFLSAKVLKKLRALLSEHMLPEADL